jgi:ACS family tartrate transporter-like MFS transporter
VSAPVPTHAPADAVDPGLAARTRRRTMRRLLPFLVLLYLIAYLDRVNVSYAALTMTEDLGFSPAVYGFGAGIFFVGYTLLEIPGTLLVERWSARLWIARIMISWGIVAVLTGFIQSATQFYWIRFLLGVMEAGFFPGIIVYLSHWFPERDRAKAVAIFMTAVPLASILGAPVSGVLLGRSWLGLQGWRWIFILEGLPAVLAGVAVLFLLTDWPRQARWLQPAERDWLTTELERERRARGEVPHGISDALRSLRDPRVLVLAFVYFFAITGMYGFGLWLPTMVKSLSGLPDLLVTLLAALPYVVAFPALALSSLSSDRTGERHWHAAVPLLVASVGLFLSAVLSDDATLSIAAFCLAAAGIYGFFGGFWALPTTYLTGASAAAAVGMINSLGNLGGFAGPYVVGWIDSATGSFLGGMMYLAASTLAGAVLVLWLKRMGRAR